ncbi:hypothetical protein J132_10810 [Termitomyces sp. J132]|nr:hypothetical protein J132_10810 [Termitomyces sp. J132]
MALFTLTPLIGELNACENVESAMSFSRWGPAVRPIAGGFISQSQNKVGICRHRDRLGLGGGNSVILPSCTILTTFADLLLHWTASRWTRNIIGHPVPRMDLLQRRVYPAKRL